MLYKDHIGLLYCLILRFLRHTQLEITSTVGNKLFFFLTAENVLQA